MKQLPLILFLTLISIITSFSQSYQTVNSSAIAYFDNDIGNVEAIRIDSAKYNTDSVLYPFTTIQQLGAECFSPNRASWIGKEVIVKENGINEFFTKEGDTIIIHTQALYDDSWIAYQLEDSLTIEATITGHDTLSFLGLNDSVKTISFQCYDKNMDLLIMDLNEMQVQISKNYGFVKTLNFYLFPHYNVVYPNDELEEYSLVGLSNPEVGVQNLTWFDVHDFQVGDEIHVLYESEYGISKTFGHSIRKIIYKYVERADYTDSIVYKYYHVSSYESYHSDGSEFFYFDDTLTSTIKRDTLFDKLPGESIISDFETFSYNMTNGSPLTKTEPSIVERHGSSGDSCWYSAIIADDCIRVNNYYKGLGGPYYYCDNSFSLGSEERKLVYYRKGETTWGTPLDISSVNEFIIDEHIEIYPNPAQKHISVSIPASNNSAYNLHIYSFQGKLLKSVKLEGVLSEVDISNLETGLYVIKISDNKSIYKIDKLIIH